MTTRYTPATVIGGDTSSAFAAQDLNTIRQALDGIALSSDNVSRSLVRTFASAIASGRSFNDTLASIGTSLSSMALNTAVRGLFSGATNLLGDALGGLSSSVAPFADGGIVASPTFFGTNPSFGLMGERGAEAILPLSRGPNRQLGIAAQNGQPPVSVTVNISATDAESFRKSEGQITGALARAVARGQRNL
ncbi:MAG: phage tail tape measure protein [Methylobacteriaceae bacterium]|nr:phage tail tape measure protein [Methylobacteriaceae bacterium]